MYDITRIFQEIENQLVSSMCRNLSRHVHEEQEADANYPQWQTKQLQALERYRKENLKKFSKQFEDINNGLKKYLEMTYNSSKTATEHDIITNLLESSTPTNALGVNQEKLNALIKSVTDDFQKAEYSLLRRSNDLYRQTIYKAQIGLNTGSITLNQAIDMATKDFLSNGINSIRYKNGNLVNIASYSEMALRTAEKRATMYGDGEKRQEWDIDTVVVYGHNGACPLCSRWQNRVYIDDVYSNGKPNNKYPLLSVAIQGGLYHPNCKCPPPQTYIEGITDPPTQKTPQELEKDIQNYNLEQVQCYHERQIRKYKRLEANSLDENNRKKYAIKVQEWQSKQREFINAHPETLRRDYSREKVRVLNITEPPKNAIEVTRIIKQEDKALPNISRKLDKNGNYVIIKDSRFDDCATIEHLENYATENWFIPKVDLKDVNFKACKETFIGMQQVLDDFPFLTDYIKSLSYTNRDALMTTRVNMSKQADLFFDLPTYSTLKNARNDSNSVTGYYPKNTSISANGMHELGHVMELYLANQRSSKQTTQDICNLYHSHTISKDIVYKVCGKLLNIPHPTFKQTQNLLEIEVSTLSEYAYKEMRKQNFCEIIAESFGDYYTNKENSQNISKTIIEIIKEEVGKYESY